MIKKNHNQRKKCSVIAQVGLVFGNHPERESKMKRPRHADHRIKQSAVRLDVVKNTERSVNRDGENAVDRKKIRRERDPEISAVRHDVTAFGAHAKTADATAH